MVKVLQLRLMGTTRTVLTCVCVLLVLLLGTVQAVHVHSENSPTHPCSLCSVARAGVLMTAASHSAPTLTCSTLVAAPQILSEPALFESSLYIRPPPLA